MNRRDLLKLTGIGAAALGMMSVDAPAFAQNTLAWDRRSPRGSASITARSKES